jgi:nucleoside-diphosphate-sugar epimerase
MNTVVVLGASSMLGREIIRQLEEKKVSVIRAGRGSDCEVKVDLGSENDPVYACEKVADVLIHCAGTFYGDDLEGIRNNFRINAFSAINVLNIIKKMGIRRVVYAGTISSEAGIEPGLPITSYGASKMECEHILEWGLTRQKGTFCSLRLTQLMDTSGDCCRHQSWFGRIVAYAYHGQMLRMPPANETRNFLHVQDAARLIIAAAESSLTGCFSVTNPTDTNMLSLANQAYELFGRGGKVIIAKEKRPFRKIRYPHDGEIFEALDVFPSISAIDCLHLVRDAGSAVHFGPMDVQ